MKCDIDFGSPAFNLLSERPVVAMRSVMSDTTRSANASFQPRRFTTYERDANHSDEAHHRRYNRLHSRFDQPDPSDSSYDLADPQSLNRYAYVGNDPVNFTDPSGLHRVSPDYRPPDDLSRGGGFWSLGLHTFYETGSVPLAHDRETGQMLVGIYVQPLSYYVGAWAQNPYSGREIMREGVERYKAKQRAAKLNRQAWMDYAECLSKDPAVIEYNQALNAANLRASLPLPGALAIGKVSGRTERGVALISHANIFTLAASAMINVLIANPSAEVRPLLEKLRPVMEECMKQAKEKFGFTPVHPYDYVRPKSR